MAALERRDYFPAPPVAHHALQLALRRLRHMVKQRYRGQHARPHRSHALVTRGAANSFLKTCRQIAPLRLREQVLAPVEDQRLLPQVITRTERPGDGPPARLGIARNLEI